MCNNAVNSYSVALKFVPEWFLTSETKEKLDNAVFANDDVV